MPKIITRSEWGAASPKSRRAITVPSSGLWLHHTAGSEPDGAEGVRAIQRFHQGPQRGWSDIAYNFVVDRQGAIFEGRGAGVQGAHTQGYNTDHAICVVGHYDNERPTSASLDAVADLVAHGHERGWWPDEITGGHRDVGSTSCPGRHLYAQIDTINRLAQEDDMTPAQARMLEEIHDVLGIQTVDGRGRMQATEGWNLSNWLVKAMPGLVAARIDPAQVDSGAVADAIREGLGDEVAGRVADEIKRRL